MDQKSKEEFEEALNNVNNASENVRNILNKFINRVSTVEDLNYYLKCVKDFNNLNEKFKDAVFKYYGFRPNETGFEN